MSTLLQTDLLHNCESLCCEVHQYVIYLELSMESIIIFGAQKNVRFVTMLMSEGLERIYVNGQREKISKNKISKLYFGFATKCVEYN